jgi:hypothetical protein
MRLRLAVHTGVVRSDGDGLVGTAVNHVFRLLEAAQLKQLILRTGADVALIASDRVHEDVIRHGLGLVNPSEYHRVAVQVKETVAPAWIRIPGMPMHPVAPVSHTIVDRPPPPAPRALPTAPDRPQLVASATIIDRKPAALDAVVDTALAIRQLGSRNVRNQIVDELPLALAALIERTDDDRGDMMAIVRACNDSPHGLEHLLGVLRQFAGDSAQVDELKKSIEKLVRA